MLHLIVRKIIEMVEILKGGEGEGRGQLYVLFKKKRVLLNYNINLIISLTFGLLIPKVRKQIRLLQVLWLNF